MSTDPEEIQAKFDENASAEGLNRQQAYLALCALGHNPLTTEIDTYFVDHDKGDDDDACLCCDEFQDFVTNLGDPTKELKKAFALFDTDGNGSIDRTELMDTLEKISRYTGESVDDETVDSLWANIDTDEDGKITFDGKCVFNVPINHTSSSIRI